MQNLDTKPTQTDKPFTPYPRIMKKAILLLAAIHGLTFGELNAQVSKTILVETAGTIQRYFLMRTG